ncbi:hypothetical protein ACFFX0_31120 [Citricoccus parietis]|uniref:Uncharacterized protein n=1 Tax=Citricoccus parietis TaxID=592307 RepID=A0ABV5G8V9_9MICC
MRGQQIPVAQPPCPSLRSSIAAPGLTGQAPVETKGVEISESTS